MAQAARNGLDVDTGAKQLGRVRVPEPMQLAEVASTPCCKYLRIDRPPIFVCHNVMVSAQPITKGEKPLCHEKAVLAKLGYNERRHYYGPGSAALGLAGLRATP